MSFVGISCLDLLASRSVSSSWFLVKLSIIVCILVTSDLSLMVSSDWLPVSSDTAVLPAVISE